MGGFEGCEDNFSWQLLCTVGIRIVCLWPSVIVTEACLYIYQRKNEDSSFTEMYRVLPKCIESHRGSWPFWSQGILSTTFLQHLWLRTVVLNLPQPFSTGCCCQVNLPRALCAQPAQEGLWHIHTPPALGLSHYPKAARRASMYFSTSRSSLAQHLLETEIYGLGGTVLHAPVSRSRVCVRWGWTGNSCSPSQNSLMQEEHAFALSLCMGLFYLVATMVVAAPALWHLWVVPQHPKVLWHPCIRVWASLWQSNRSPDMQ